MNSSASAETVPETERSDSDAHRLAETHVPILEALRGGDEAEAVEALRFHIDVARVLVTQQFRDLEDGPSE